MQIKFHATYRKKLKWLSLAKSKQKKFEDDLKINYAVKNYILQKVSNTWV